jgi:mono/diheme cytochrome c family protein
MAAAADGGESPAPPAFTDAGSSTVVTSTPVIARTGASAPSRVEAGRDVYLKHCARCHGEKGEGIDAPALIDETASRLQSYPTAATLFQYIRILMPLDAPGSLSEGDYWAVVAYLLVRNGVIEENVPVGPETAERIMIRR